MSCIFCGEKAEGATVSHILPASLGGEEWACLPDGIVCSGCNQYFGEKVESFALGSFPFLPFRLLLGIPTRKGSPPSMKTHLGTLRSSHLPGQIGIDPVTAAIETGIENGKISQLRIPAEPAQPEAVCRMLVKMGLEVVAADSAEDARNARFNSARLFARAPSRGTEWWWFMSTNHEQLFERFRDGISTEDWLEGVSLSVHRFEQFEAFRLQLLDIVIITPLDTQVMPPPMIEFPEPEHRLFHVRI
jgi:HNH endonuclease